LTEIGFSRRQAQSAWRRLGPAHHRQARMQRS
jgi:hypothetical protein